MARFWIGAIALMALVSVSATSTQGPALDRVMRKKLECAQKILEAVVTSRWADLEAQSKEMEALTNDTRDLDATPQAYAALTLSCVQCHRYLARERIARQ